MKTVDFIYLHVDECQYPYHTHTSHQQPSGHHPPLHYYPWKIEQQKSYHAEKGGMTQTRGNKKHPASNIHKGDNRVA